VPILQPYIYADLRQQSALISSIPLSSTRRKQS
jgi:hypothetical protein